MSSIPRTTSTILLLLFLFVVMVFVESSLRSAERRQIPVDTAEAPGLAVDGFVQPDFLWVGEAWWIDIETEQTLELVIDGEWCATVPPGKHTIHSNHDSNNTRSYGGSYRHETPSSIDVRVAAVSEQVD